MSRRTAPPPTLSEREARARAVTVERLNADRAAERATRLADVRARLALAQARRRDLAPPRAPIPPRDPLAELADSIRAEARARAAAPTLTGMTARVVLPVLDDLLTGVTEYARDIEWSRP